MNLVRLRRIRFSRAQRSSCGRKPWIVACSTRQPRTPLRSRATIRIPVRVVSGRVGRGRRSSRASTRRPSARVGELTAPNTCGWAPSTTCAPASSAAAASCCWRSDGSGCSSVPQWNQQTTTSACAARRAHCGRDGVGVGLGRPGRVGGCVEPVRVDVGEADEADPQPARLHDHRAAARRRRSLPPPTVSRPAACAYLIVSSRATEP